MQTITQQFLNKYKKLEAELKQLAGVHSDFTNFRVILDKAKANNVVIQYQEKIIWDLYGLRNVFAHSDREKYIAKVNKLAFNELDKMLNLLNNPPTVGDIFKGQVFLAETNNRIEKILKRMQENLYTHIPVYNGSKFIGVFSETTILELVVENIKRKKEKRTELLNGLIGEITPKYLNNQNNRYEFVPANCDIFTVLKMFENAISKKQRLGAIFITPNGNKHRRPIGIITAWDLPKIKNYLK